VPFGTSGLALVPKHMLKLAVMRLLFESWFGDSDNE